MSSPRSNKAPVATVVGAAAGTAAAAAVLVRMVSKNTLDLQANMRQVFRKVISRTALLLRTEMSIFVAD